MTTLWLIAVLAGSSTALLVPPVARLPAADPPGARRAADASGQRGRRGGDWMSRWRPLWSVLSGLAALAFLGGPLGLVAAPLAAGGCWLLIGRAEPPELAKERATAQAELPHLVRLLSSALAAGAAPAEALAVVVDALPGPAAARLAPVAARLRLGADPVTTWRELVGDAALAPLGRTLSRAHATGAPVAVSVARLADELTRGARAEVEDRARRVGVKAAVPLGLCLLPSFLLLGVVPVVGSLLSQLQF